MKLGDLLNLTVCNWNVYSCNGNIVFHPLFNAPISVRKHDIDMATDRYGECDVISVDTSSNHYVDFLRIVIDV